MVFSISIVKSINFCLNKHVMLLHLHVQAWKICSVQELWMQNLLLSKPALNKIIFGQKINLACIQKHQDSNTVVWQIKLHVSCLNKHVKHVVHSEHTFVCCNIKATLILVGQSKHDIFYFFVKSRQQVWSESASCYF